MLVACALVAFACEDSPLHVRDSHTQAERTAADTQAGSVAGPTLVAKPASGELRVLRVEGPGLPEGATARLGSPIYVTDALPVDVHLDASGKRLEVIDGAARLSVWDVATGQLERQLELPHAPDETRRPVARLAPGHAAFCSSRTCQPLSVVDTRTAQVVATIEATSPWDAPIVGFGWCRDTKLAVGSRNEIAVWSADDGEVVSRVALPDIVALGVASAPSTALAAAVGKRGEQHIVLLEAGGELAVTHRFRVADDVDMIDVLTVSPDGSHVAASDLSGRLFVWTASGELRWESTLHREHADTGYDEYVEARGERRPIRPASLRLELGAAGLEFDPSGEQLLSVGRDGIVVVWEASSGRQLLRRGEFVYTRPTAARFSGDGRSVVHGWFTGRVLIERLGDQTVVRPPESHLYGIDALQLLPGQDRLMTFERRRIPWQPGQTVADFVTVDELLPVPRGATPIQQTANLLVWDLATRAIVERTLVHEAFALSGGRLLLREAGTFSLEHKGTRTPLAALDEHVVRAVSPDGTFLVTSSSERDPRLEVRDSERFTEAAVLDGCQSSEVVLSHQAEVVAQRCGTDHGDLRLWRRPYREPLVVGEKCDQFLLTRDGTRVVCIRDWDRELDVLVFDTRDASQLDQWTLKHAEAGPAALAPDGQWLAVVNGDAIHLYDVASASTRVLEGHSGHINDLTTSPDGLVLYSASDDGTVLVWQTSTRED